MGILDIVEQQELAKRLMSPCLFKNHQFSLISWKQMKCLRCDKVFPVEVGNIDKGIEELYINGND